MILRRMLLTFPLVAVGTLACAMLTVTPEPAAEVGLETSTSQASVSFTPTPASSPTEIVTKVSAPTKTPRHRDASPTPTPVQEPTGLAVVMPSATAESPQEPSPTFTPPPLPPVTASSTPGPNTAGAKGPTIGFFRADVEEADPGDTITLEWATSNAITVTLWHLAPTGQFSHFWNVDANGAFNYEINPNERNRTTFALSAVTETSNTEMATVAVSLRCPNDWFFPNPPDICPVTAALESAGAEQSFEQGFMIWVAGENRIYILFGDGNSPKWNAYADEWDPGEPEYDPTLEPPPGLFQPIRGFGLLWREQPNVRERLGWATGEEMAYGTALQRTSYAKYNETYIRAAGGGIWQLQAERSGWEKLSG